MEAGDHVTASVSHQVRLCLSFVPRKRGTRRGGSWESRRCVCSCKTVVYRASLASPAFLPPRSLVAVASVDPSPPMPVPISLPFFFASHEGSARQDTLSQSGRGVNKRQTAFQGGSDQASLDSLSPSDRITSQKGSGGGARRKQEQEGRTGHLFRFLL